MSRSSRRWLVSPASWKLFESDAASAPLPEARFAALLVLGFAALAFLLWLLTSLHPDYGYFADELNYLTCARRLDLGFVDHPPLAPLILALNGALLGDSLPAMRLPAALCGAATILLAARIAWRLGGGPAAQLLAALCVAAAPVFTGIFSFFSTNCFDVLLWTLALSALVELGRSRDERLWWLVGLFLGLAIQAKHTGAVLAAATAVALVISPMRRQLLGANVWLGAGLSLLIVSPNLYWQVQHDWASLEFYALSDAQWNVPVSALRVLEDQIGSFNPAAFPVWLAGLYFFLASRRGRPHRLVGWVAVVLFTALLLGGKSRPDRIMGIYPVLFAAGAVQLEALSGRRGFGWLRYAVPAAVLVVGGAVAPMVVPVLAPETAARYLDVSGDVNDIQREVGQARLLVPLAHRMGHEDRVEAISRVYAALEASERAGAILLTEEPGTAGAVELLGQGLPPIYFPLITGYLWGPPPSEPGLVITVGYEPEMLARFFASFEVVDRVACTYCMGQWQDVPIALARAPRRPLREAWADLREVGRRKDFLLEKARQAP